MEEKSNEPVLFSCEANAAIAAADADDCASVDDVADEALALLVSIKGDRDADLDEAGDDESELELLLELVLCPVVLCPELTDIVFLDLNTNLVSKKFLGTKKSARQKIRNWKKYFSLLK